VKETSLIFSRRSSVDLGEVKELFTEVLPLLNNFPIKVYQPEHGQLAYEHASNWASETLRTQINWSNV
jgi:hypothetical protein